MSMSNHFEQMGNSDRELEEIDSVQEIFWLHFPPEKDAGEVRLV